MRGKSFCKVNWVATRFNICDNALEQSDVKINQFLNYYSPVEYFGETDEFYLSL